MVYGLNGRESDIEVFDYILAEKLHCHVADLDRMSYREYSRWHAYYVARGMDATMRKVG